MNKSDLIKFLTDLGLKKKDAEKIAKDNPDDGKDTIEQDDLKTIVSDFKEDQSQFVKNDKEFIDKIKGEEAAKLNDIWRTKVKRAAGLTNDDIKDKSNDEIVKIGFDVVRKKGDATSEEIQKENIELINKIKKLEEEEIPRIKNETKNYQETLRKEALLEKLIISKKLRSSPNAAIAVIKDKLSKGYKIDFNDKGELELFVDGEGKIKAKNKDGSKLMSIDDFITETLEDEKLLELSNGGKGDGKQIEIKGGNKDSLELQNRFPHLNQAKTHGQAVKEAIDARKGEK